MCVAAIIFEPLPLGDLRGMERHNPHGAGVAWVEPGDDQVSFVRGLSASDIYHLQAQLTFPYMAHFRWTTHGATGADMTHPFPTGVRAFFGELEGRTARVLMHNGIWPGHSTIWQLPGLPLALMKRASDTAIAAYLLDDHPELAAVMPWATAVGWAGARGMEFQLEGRWMELQGNLFSNLHWQTPRWSSAETLWAWDEEPDVDDEPLADPAPSDDFDTVNSWLAARMVK